MAANVVPSDCFECDGQAVSRTDFKKLFDAIGTAWGSGDGSTTFNVPDLRDRSLYGKGTRVPFAGTDGNTYAGGSRGGPYHHHDFSGSTNSNGGHSHSQGSQNIGGVTAGGSFTASGESSTGGVGDHSHGFSGQTSGGYGSTPSFAGALYVICAGQSTA